MSGLDSPSKAGESAMTALWARRVGKYLQQRRVPSSNYGERGSVVIILGIICLILGFIFSIPILWTIGIILVVIGVILAILGATGRAVGGRAHYY